MLLMLDCQNDAFSHLKDMAYNDAHSILISGVESCGKTYLANHYSKLVHADQLIRVEPNVSNFREMLDAVIQFDTSVVVCIENLDLGNTAAAQVLLKNLEEPNPNVYFIITCRNIKRIPATILSRAFCVQINVPTDKDIITYAESKDKMKAFQLQNSKLWKCVKTFGDVDILLNMSYDNQMYIENIPAMLNSSESISTLQWNLGHYSDNSVMPVTFAIRYIMYNTNIRYLKKLCLKCLNEISIGRIGISAIIAKFLLEYKYGSD